MSKRAAAFTALVLTAAVVSALCLTAGSVKIPLSGIMAALAGSGGDYESVIIMQIRLPRILLGFMVGGMLGLCGAMLQAVLKNPLVDPFITGISSGAALGATAAIMAGIGEPALFAAAMAMATIFLVYRISFKYGRLNTTGLLLTGVMTGSFFSGLIMLSAAVFNRDLVKIMFWLMGDLSSPGWPHIAAAVIVTIPVFGACMYFSNDLNILSAGEEEAGTMGVNTEFIKLFYFAAAGILTGLAVSLSGVIGFVGLLIPHIMRFIFGADMRLLMPASFLGGGIFLIGADTLARSMFLPVEVPVGIITGLIGAPVFIIMLMRRKDI
ncbi:MAG TPA: iron ABC transporter permease [bacterium]|nr:iron ABC transporter permease [bacterium]